MTLAYWPLALLCVLALVGGGWWWLRRTPTAQVDLLAAHTDRLMASPRFARLIAAERRRALISLVCVGSMLLGSLLLVGRLASATTTEDAGSNRDIVLCLDVSNSMLIADEKVLDSYARLATRLRGERIALVIWNGSARTVFPLTDDTELIAEQLAAAAQALKKSDLEFKEGTTSGRGGYSLIGDGLASCLMRFDRLDQPRSRTIVLATDNDPDGKENVTVPQAIDMAVAKKIVVHSIAPQEDQLVGALRQQTHRTGGELYLLGYKDSSEGIVAAIEGTEARRMTGTKRVRISDIPGVGVTFLALGLLGLVGADVIARRRR